MLSLQHHYRLHTKHKFLLTRNSHNLKRGSTICKLQQSRPSCLTKTAHSLHDNTGTKFAAHDKIKGSMSAKATSQFQWKQDFRNTACSERIHKTIVSKLSCLTPNDNWLQWYSTSPQMSGKVAVSNYSPWYRCRTGNSFDTVYTAPYSTICQYSLQPS